MTTEKQVQRAIKALDAAHAALEPLVLEDPADNPRNGVVRLRSDIAEYADYLERATWWRGMK